jgi:RNA polymerase sigma-70 factor (sigma-E family)
VSELPTIEFREWAAVVRPRLRRTAYLLTGDWHQAEDLVQEALVRVSAVWRRVAASGAPDAYAAKTVVNAYRAARRRSWRREYPVDPVPSQHLRAHEDGTYDDREMLLAALAALGPSQRAVVVLRYWEDMSVAQVAEILRISPGTVKSQAARGLAQLRRVVGELDQDSTRTGESA